MEKATSTGTRVRSWLGLERNIVVMLLIFFLIGMGEELWVRFVPKYLLLLGAGAWEVACYGALRDLLDALYAYPGGWITDRLGRGRALALFALLAIAGYGVYLFAPSWPWVLGGTVLVMAWSSLTLPTIFAIVGDSLPPSRRALGFGVQAILKRVPIAVAPVLGGWLIGKLGLGRGIQAGLAVTAVLAFGGIALVRSSYAEAPSPAPAPGRLRDHWQGMEGGLKRLLLADALARWAEGIPKVFVILFVIDVLGATAADFGWLTSAQVVAATLIYLPVAKMADRTNRKPFVLVTFGFFALFPLVLAMASGPFWLVGAFLIAGLRELGEPARKALIVDLASATARGRGVGLYYLLRGLAVFPAPLVGGWLWTLDRRLPFYAAFAVGVAGFVAHARWGPSDAPGMPASERVKT